ncbi:fascin domain-containing protein [Photorhabdus africana]|uniref:fascin domain-containing protein n=1 Tax=Photorhabdus africana TaxID=3097554 RepID=UPI002B4071AA|nr:hypothetical protein [Photorhabdus sp. CRI-LC]
MGLPNITIALQADNNLYLSRVDQMGVQYIEAAKSSIDVYSTFTVEDVGCNVIALRADNGKYLSRVTLNGVDYIIPYGFQDASRRQGRESPGA